MSNKTLEHEIHILKIRYTEFQKAKMDMLSHWYINDDGILSYDGDYDKDRALLLGREQIFNTQFRKVRELKELIESEI